MNSSRGYSPPEQAGPEHIVAGSCLGLKEADQVHERTTP